MMKIWMICILMVHGLILCTSQIALAQAPQILFIGNSLTRRNNLPGAFLAIARSAGRRVSVYASTLPSGTFGAHAASQQTLGLLYSRNWTVIVMQEQSFFLSIGAQYEMTGSWPPALQLARIARRGGRQPRILLYETMAYLTGHLTKDTYEAMQQRVIDGYGRLARYLGCEVAHVGSTWRRARLGLQAEGIPVSTLYSDDVHPSPKGTFLAAAAIYRQAFRANPITNLRPSLSRGVGRVFANKALRWAEAEYLHWQANSRNTSLL